jgi:hypothetical protein
MILIAFFLLALGLL